MSADREPLVARIVRAFLTGHLTPLLILLSLAVGVVALIVTPREEEPQIVVPLADVFIEVPGASAEEVERLVATPLESLLYQIDGVEYVYSMSSPDRAVVTVRFHVGEDREDSLVKLQTKLQTNPERVPPQVAGWVVKPVEIDDVPIVAITLHSATIGDHALRRIAEELEPRIQAVADTGRTRIISGAPRVLQVVLDPDRMRARGVTLPELRAALQAAARILPAGETEAGERLTRVEAGAGITDHRALAALVVGVHGGRPVSLGQVADVTDGPGERASYTRLRLRGVTDDEAAVTLAVAKKKGVNAVTVARAVRARVRALQAELIPDGVSVRISRDYGETADHKVGELLEGLVVAILIVVLLIAMTLGWREGLIIATAVPITFALTLLFNQLAGYSINRVTLFALILALGLVVDDPIVDVENIYRHLRLGLQKPLDAVLTAVNEVRPPIIQATLAVMISFLPLFFITGMMGPYMAPMAFNVPLAMLMSLVVAFTITPWMAYKILAGHVAPAAGPQPSEAEAITGSGLYRIYAVLMGPLLRRRALRWTALAVTAALFAGSLVLGLTRRVPLKMLPYDNKNELGVVLDLPEGTPLERTEAACAELAAALCGYPEVTDVLSHVGTSGPMDFNGLVRHHYLRRAPHLADLRVNLVHKTGRVEQSHALVLRMRQTLLPIARRHGATLQVVEVPPGPPVIATITAEVYAPDHVAYAEQTRAAEQLARRLAREAGVVDVDTTAEAPQARRRFVLDQEKAALAGVSNAKAATLLRAALSGEDVATLRAPHEANPLPINLRLPRDQRQSSDALLRLPVGAGVALGELGRFVDEPPSQTIYHKNLRRVAYVFAEVAGRAPAEVILDVQADRRPAGAALPADAPVPVESRDYLRRGAGLPWQLPAGISVDWAGEGEWKITLDVFRDLGLAFAAACLGIYMLLVHETGSYLMPLILMLSIPFTVIGILPGFWLLNLVTAGSADGVPDPVFFTATAMIGMIALSGIAVRNAILLIEFVHRAVADGLGLREAILRSGAVRFRPIFLTAGTALLAAVPITLDPIFSGLAWALIFGLLVSSGFTLFLVPMVYFMVYGRAEDAGPGA